jgi:hypothetical protein
METKEHQDIKANLLQSVNGHGNCVIELNYQLDHYKDIAHREYATSDLITKLNTVKQDKIKVMELVVESEIDFIKSAEKLKSVFDTEFKNMVKQLNDRFNAEIINLQQTYRKLMIGEGLINLVNEVSEAGWVLVMKNKSVNLYRCYNPAFDVTEGFYESGEVYDYNSPVTLLRGIYVNVLHPKITTGTIHLSTEGGRHPNCDSDGFGSACPGTLDGREIPVHDVKSLIALLDEIGLTYERMHLDSAYFVPASSHTIRKEEPQWTTQ